MGKRSASSHERRYLNIVFFSFGLILASYLIQVLVTGYYERNWDRLVGSETSEYLDRASARFGTLQRAEGRLGGRGGDRKVNRQRTGWRARGTRVPGYPRQGPT